LTSTCRWRYCGTLSIEVELAYSTMWFVRHIIDGRAMMCSIVALTIGPNQGRGYVEYGEIYDIHFLPVYRRMLAGSSCRWSLRGDLARKDCSIITLAIQHNRGMGAVEHGEIYDIYVLPAYLRLFDGPSLAAFVTLITSLTWSAWES